MKHVFGLLTFISMLVIYSQHNTNEGVDGLWVFLLLVFIVFWIISAAVEWLWRKDK